MNKLKLSLFVAGTAALGLMPQVSQATAIMGSISFFGNVTPYVGPPSAPGTVVASGYNTAQSLIFGFTQVAVGANGSFGGIAANTTVNMTSPLGINPPQVLPPGVPLWSVGGFSFTLMSLSEPVDSPNVLVLQGLGTMSDGNPSDTTMGSWVATFTSATASSGVTFSWNSSSQTNAPESGTNLLIMGLGLAGLAAFAKFRKQSAVVAA